MKSYLQMIYLFILFAMAACNGQQSEDPGKVSTRAVQTYQAELTKNITLTTLPTETPSPSSTPLLNQPLPTLTIEVSDIQSTPNVPDKGEFIGQTPKDNTEFRINSKFRVTWAVKNVGKTTWKRNYKIRYFAGAALGERSEYNFLENVPPGGTGKFVIDMITPAYVGEVTTVWVLTNSDGQNFFPVYLTINAVNRKPRTPTPLPTHTPTVTITP